MLLADNNSSTTRAVDDAKVDGGAKGTKMVGWFGLLVMLIPCFRERDDNIFILF